jgi:amidase
VTDDFAALDATAQAELVRSRQVKPIELVDAAIERVERVNPKINAIVTPMYDLAREAAKGSLPEGPFSGVPFLLKDLTAAYAGVPMSMGSRFLKGYTPAQDTTLVTRYKAAGLIVIGKANTPEFGLVPTTEPYLWGPCRNPWNTDRTTGGSSGGSSAAVAAGIVPMAHANDGGGSIRIPASCCGLFGLKPTRARNPLGPALGDVMNGLVAEHVVSRTVRDSAAVLDATAGPDVGDPYPAPPPERPFIEEVGADPGKLRIAFATKTLEGKTVHPDCVAAVQDAVELCQDLGHEVTEASPVIPWPLLVQSFTTMWAAGAAQGIDGLSLLSGRAPADDQLEPLTKVLAQTGRTASASAYLLAVTMMQTFSRTIARFFLDYDLWLTPTLAEPPLPLGSFDFPDDPMQGFQRAAEFVPFTPTLNGTGQPAMSVPLYWNDEGLPIGVHFAARFGDEATLFRLAAQLEQARPWAGKRPPVSALPVSA